MSLNDRPSGERIHIAFFGRRNVGKSSVVNAVTGQNISIVSDVKGTTTDPVSKTMELLPIGPVVIIDTAGIDDEGVLGQMRIAKTRQIMRKTDIAVLVADAERGLTQEDQDLLEIFRKEELPCLILLNKCDLLEKKGETQLPPDLAGEHALYVSALEQIHIFEAKEMLGAIVKQAEKEKEDKTLIGDLIDEDDLIILVTPIDASAPKGRLILPQQQTIRDILDHNAYALTVKEMQLKSALHSCRKKPRMVITDSQAFGIVSKIVPQDMLLTSFSILFARFKGNLEQCVEGAAALKKLKDGDRILVSEGCSHHRQCGDIGTVKLPHWISEYTGKKLEYCYTSGQEFPESLKDYALVVHCGGCMLNEREMHSRLRQAKAEQVPMTNYGITIAQTHGILKRSLSPFPDLAALLPL